MKKILGIMFCLSLTLGLSACSSGEVSSEDSNNNAGDNTTEVKEENKVYGIGDTITYSEDGKELYTLTINSVTSTSERNEFWEEEVAQVIIIDYTYENIGSDEDVYISSFDFTVIDSDGNVCDTYPASINDYPQDVPTGAKCTAQEAYGLKSESSSIKLRFQPMFSSTKVNFELTVE